MKDASYVKGNVETFPSLSLYKIKIHPLKLHITQIEMFMVLLPYLKPYNVTLIPTLDLIFKIWKVIATLYIILRAVSRSKSISRECLPILAFALTWIVSIFANANAPTDLISNVLSIIGITLYFEMNKSKILFKKYITAFLYAISAVYMLLNFISVLIGHPFFYQGSKLDDNANFLGGDNYSAFIIIASIGFMILYDVYLFRKVRVKTIIMSIVGTAGLLVTFSLAGALSCIIFYVSFFGLKSKRLNKLFDYRNAIIICILSLIIVSLSIGLPFIGEWLNNVGKSGFNGRGWIWPYSMIAITKKPILGYGGVDSELASTWFIAGANHTHNLLLEYPFSTGCIGAILFWSYFHLCAKKAKKANNIECKALLLSVNAYFMCSIFDFYIGLIYIYILLELMRVFSSENSARLCNNSTN